MSERPFTGLRVLEWGAGTACSYAGLLFSDRGADVIKVEPPEGDDLRWRDSHADQESKHFQWLARGKRSIVVDDETGAGRDVLNRLAASVDVVLTTWPGARLERPYMSQGQFATLGEVLHYYSTLENAVQLDHHQEQVLTPLEFTDRETTDLLAFLESLTGSPIAPELTSQPKSPIRDR